MYRAAWAITVLSLTLGACSVSTQRRAQVVGEDKVPFQLLEPAAPPAIPPGSEDGYETVMLCFLSDGRLVPVDQLVAAPVGLVDAVRALAQPPVVDRATVRTAVGDPSVVEDVVHAGGVARVDLRRSIADLGGQNQLLAVAQIVCTLTGRPGIGQVSFTLEGAPVDVPRGDGSVVSHPVSRDDYAALLG